MRVPAIILTFLLLGCDKLVAKAYRPPTASFAGAGVSQIGLTGGVIDVQLWVHNPNPYALTSTGASYRVLVGADTAELGHGSTTDTVRVGAKDSALVQLPVEVSWRQLRNAGSEAMRGGAVEYRVLGTVTAATPIGSHVFPLSVTGRATLPRL